MKRCNEAQGSVSGTDTQHPPAGADSSFKDFMFLLDRAVFGCSREAGVVAHGRESIEARNCDYPCVHRQMTRSHVSGPDTPAANHLPEEVISLAMGRDTPNESAKKNR